MAGHFQLLIGVRLKKYPLLTWSLTETVSGEPTGYSFRRDPSGTHSCFLVEKYDLRGDEEVP